VSTIDTAAWPVVVRTGQANTLASETVTARLLADAGVISHALSSLRMELRRDAAPQEPRR
jgi:hypothetical protein